MTTILTPYLSAAADDDDDPSVTDILAPKTGLPVIRLDSQRQKLAGIETVTLQAIEYRPECMAIGKAINVQPLVALRGQYRVALSEQRSADAKMTQSKQSIRRTQALFSHGVAAKRALEEQQALWQADKAQLEARRALIDAVLQEARVNWGTELVEWAFANAKDRLSSLVSGEDVLLLVTLPAGKNLPAIGAGEAVFVAPDGNRGQAVPAVFISSAPQTDPAIQGSSYFFRAEGKKIRPGMTVSVWLPEGRKKETGVAVPRSALIWSMDQAFVYVKSAPDTFSRRLLADYSPAPEGYFVRETFAPGEEIVTVGGQVLFSEEFSAQIPDEDD